MTDEKLDLLLRQALNLEIADHDIQIDAAKIKSDRNTTVSYTHLDVYKRQTSKSPQHDFMMTAQIQKPFR